MIREILDSLRAYRQAFGLLWKLGLWKYFAIPMLITFVTAIAIVAFACGLPRIIIELACAMRQFHCSAKTIDIFHASALPII